MKFYNREEELRLLNETRKQSFESHSLFTVVTGRRRVGKTKLILRSCEGTPTVYLFVACKNEGDLCERFAQVISSSLNIHFSNATRSFADLFASLMEIGRNISFNLVLDEFQEFYYINETVALECKIGYNLCKIRQ